MNKNEPHDAGLLIKMIHDAIEKVANRRLAPWGITVAQSRFLNYLWSRDEKRATQKEFEEHFGISHPTTVGILKRLERKNLITTGTDPADRRNKIVEPGSEEAVFRADMNRFRNEMEERLLRGFDGKRREELVEWLHLLLQNISE